MATFNKFNALVEHLAEGVHDFSADTLKVMLTNTIPTAGMVLQSEITEIATGNGYSAGGTAATLSSSSQTSGVYTLALADVTFTASGGTIGPFRYAVLYNDTPVSPLDPLIGWYDNGASQLLNSTETMTLDFTNAVSIT